MKKLIFVFLIGIFVFSFGSAAITNVSMLDDDFESDFSLWDGVSVTDWDLATDQSVSPSHSAHCGSAQNDLYSDGSDMSNAQAIYVSFSYRVDDLDANDNIQVYYWDGAAYDSIDEIGDDAEDTWLTFSRKITDSQYFVSDFHLYFEGSSIDNGENLWVDDVSIIKEYDLFYAPNITNVTASHSVIKGGDTITIYANTTSNGVNDTDQGTLNFYCDSSAIPTAANTDCTGGTTTDSNYPYVLTCTFSVPSDDVSHVEYCRVYNGDAYSGVVPNITYTTDTTAPSLSVVSVAGDTVASYFDSSNDGVTNITVSGETGMSCRWSSSDLSYSAMSNGCSVSGSEASCLVNDVASQGFFTRYVSCQDSLGNENSAVSNLGVSFYLDYTAPTTYDNSNSNVQVPDYSVTITEQDNVDSDPLTYYCTSSSAGCDPTILIDDGGVITYTTANRGVNYLRYYSVDDAGQSQTIVNKTININRVPVLTNAVDDAVVIQSGASVNVSTVSSDSDSGQQITLYVCNSSGATFDGCSGTQYCSATGSANLSCVFVSESDSASHTWYAYLFDDSDEEAVANSLTGSYTTDSVAPEITLMNPANGSTITQDSVTFAIISDEALTNAWYSLDDGATNVSMTNSSLFVYSHTNLSISDGDYDVVFWANDSYGNIGTLTGNSFVIDTVVPDTTVPVVTVVVPVDGSYSTSASVVLNMTASENLDWAGYTNNSGVLTDLGNVSMTNWNASVIFVEGQHDVVFYANDSSGNQGNSSVTVYVDLNNPAVTNLSCGDVSDSEDVLCVISVSDTVGLDYVIVGYNATGSWVNSSQIDLAGVSNSTTYSILSGNHSPVGFDVRLYVYDLAGRVNSSESDSVLISDDTYPQIEGVVYSPNVSDDLDPGVSVDVNATISEDYNISSVVLMYKNSSVSDWSLVAMDNNSALVVGSNSSVVYNGSFVPQAENWTFKINATDYAGNENVSAEITIEVSDDVSQDVSTTISSIESLTYSQRASNNSLGDLVMNNTGDTDLNFSVTLTSSSIQDRLSMNYSGDQTDNYSVSSGSSDSIEIDVNSSGLTSGLYGYSISVVSAAGTEVFERWLNVQTAAGPYLVTTIGTYSSSVTSGQEDVEFIATVQNLGTQDATGVYLNWTLPSSFSITSGSSSRSLGNLGIGVSGSNSIVISVSGSAADLDVEVIANATSTNVNSSSDSKSVAIGAGSVASVVEVVSGGGGGSGGGSSDMAIIYDKVIEIVRGVDDGFDIEVENEYRDSTLKSLVLDLDGFLEQYISISPDKIGAIGYGEKDYFNVGVVAPRYLGYEEYDLVAVIRGDVVRDGSVSGKYKETQNIKLIIQEITRAESEEMFLEAEFAVAEMSESGFDIRGVSKLLVDAEDWLEKRRNKKSWDLSSEVVDVRDVAFEANDLLRRLLATMQNPRKSNLITGNVISNFGGYDTSASLESLFAGRAVFTGDSSEEIVGLAIAAFERGDYYSALERAEEARMLLVLERKGDFFLFVYLYWPFIILAAVILSGLGILGFRRYRKVSVIGKIRDLNEEENNIGKLLIKLQGKYFRGSISDLEYNRTLGQHEKRLANIRKTRMSLRNKRLEMLAPRKIVKELDDERGDVEGEIKKIQQDYYVNKKLAENGYKTQFGILNERLAEIEGERATLQILKSKGMKGVRVAMKKSRAVEKKNKMEERMKNKRKKGAKRDAKKLLRKRKSEKGVKAKGVFVRGKRLKRSGRLHDINGKRLKAVRARRKK